MLGDVMSPSSVRGDHGHRCPHSYLLLQSSACRGPFGRFYTSLGLSRLLELVTKMFSYFLLPMVEAGLPRRQLHNRLQTVEKRGEARGH